MSKWSLSLMIGVLLVAPALACGFPLPAGTEMMRISKAVCAEGEAPASCQERQDAYQLMGNLQTAVITDLAMHLWLDTEGEQLSADLTGEYEYQLISANVGLGANLHAWWTEGEIVQGTETTPLNNVELIVIGEDAYLSEDGGQSWEAQAMDQNTLVGLGMFLGLGGPLGASLDLYADPAIFTVTVGPDVEIDGQTMHVQTLEVDLQKLLGTPTAALGLLEDGLAAGGNMLDMGMEDLGMTPQEFGMVLPMLAPFLQGTAFSTTLYIGAEDGYIHYVEDNFALALDLSAMDATQQPIGMEYKLTGRISGHNEPLTITAPSDVTEGNGGLFGDSGLFSSGGESGGLGDSLFGSGEGQ